MAACFDLQLPGLAILLLFVIIHIDVTRGACSGGIPICGWLHWESWSSCSRTCGGGTRWRNRGMCCLTPYVGDWLGCLSNCGKLAKDSHESGDCGDVCNNDGVIVPDNSAYYGRRCNCTQLYTGTCCDSRTCSWDNHYCWPGKCASDHASSCACHTGFYRISNASETTCQLSSSNAPSIETCDTTVRGLYGEMARAKSVSSPTACSQLDDFYGNFQPTHLIYDFMAAFNVNIESYVKPDFINKSIFGVTDVRLYVEVQDLAGTKARVLNHTIYTGSTDVQLTLNDKGNLTLGPSANQLSDGHWMCVSYETQGGGYLRSVDLTKDPRTPSAPVPYSKTMTTRQICYRYDSSPPEHCKKDTACNYEPLQISEIITRSPLITASFHGWKDPIPAGGSNEHVSNIESYQITVNEVVVAKDVLKIDTGIVYTETVGISRTSIQLKLTSETPKLYAIYIAVKDVATNARQARRFVLFDNSSKIDVLSEKTFYVESASPLSKFSWQIHHNDICINWTGHFFNTFYRDNPLLNPVEADPSGRINGVYEQVTSQLPTTGTLNIHGIVDFRYSWALNDENISSETTVPHFPRQHHCISLDLKDGDTYAFNLKAIDIAGNNFIEKRTVHVDETAPHIYNIWLVKDSDNKLLVHETTDLSKMKFYFEAMDQHSGIKEIQWIFGTSDSGLELMTGLIAVKNKDKNCPSKSFEDGKCYCPDVGQCEFYQYTHSMAKLAAEHKHIGDHNRSYFFSINVTNHALLSSVEHLDILVIKGNPDINTGSSAHSTKVIAGVSGGLVAGLIVVVIVLLIVRKYPSKGCSQCMPTKSGTVLEQRDNKDSHHAYDNATTTHADNMAPKDEGDSGGYDTLNHASEQPRMYDSMQQTSDSMEPHNNDSRNSDAYDTLNHALEQPRQYDSLQNASGSEKQQVGSRYLDDIEMTDIPNNTAVNSSSPDQPRETSVVYENLRLN